MLSTMQDVPLLVSTILRYGRAVHPDSTVVTVEADGYRTASFAEVSVRAERLATALERLGLERGDRVGTFSWNNQSHLEAYLAVPSMGSVLHTLNIRLFPEQLAYVVNHAEDRVIIVDDSLVPLLARVADELKSVETIIVVGSGDRGPFADALSYEELISSEEPGFDWPDLDERSAAAMCYTSGTTGNPKGVVYSHRSTYLHTMAQNAPYALPITESDRVLVVVPMFHANAWGVPYGAFTTGSDIVMPQQFLQGERLARTIADQRVTMACGVPTIWNDLLRVVADDPSPLSSLRTLMTGGAAAPRSLFEAFDAIGVELLQGWGMTETSPMAAVAHPPRGCPPDQTLDYRTKAGRITCGVEVRAVGPDGSTLPADGESVGEFEVRGPWVTSAYYKDDSRERFHDGWLRTGDVGTLDRLGYMQITDRTKDVIKSGGEWISSVELESAVMDHPAVFEAAVIAVADPRWQERPLVCVVPAEGASVSEAELLEHLRGRVARWWLPDRWCFIESVPKTSVGKFDKKVLRALEADGRLDVRVVELPPA